MLTSFTLDVIPATHGSHRRTAPVSRAAGKAQSLPHAATVSLLWHSETPQLRQHYDIQGSLFISLIKSSHSSAKGQGGTAPSYLTGGVGLSFPWYASVKYRQRPWQAPWSRHGEETRDIFVCFSIYINIQDLLGGSNTRVSLLAEKLHSCNSNRSWTSSLSAAPARASSVASGMGCRIPCLKAKGRQEVYDAAWEIVNIAPYSL